MKPDATIPEPPKAPGLERDRVVRVALNLLDEVGLDGLTLRRLASKLDVKAAALYWHFSNKQDLINTMAVAMLRHGLPGEHRDIPGDMSWQDILRAIANHHRTAMMSHRDGARLVSSAEFNDSSMFDGLERVLQALCRQGFTAESAFLTTMAILRYTLGCVFEEQTDPHSQKETIERQKRKLPSLAARYPLMAKTIKNFIAGKIAPEQRFTCGLELMVLGAEKQLAEQRNKTA